MPVGRMLNKKISCDKGLCVLSIEAVFVFSWIIPHLDVKGRILQEYLDKLISLMAELKRVLKPTKRIRINLDDNYFAGGRGNGSDLSDKQRSLRGSEDQDRIKPYEVEFQ